MALQKSDGRRKNAIRMRRLRELRRIKREEARARETREQASILLRSMSKQEIVPS